MLNRSLAMAAAASVLAMGAAAAQTANPYHPDQRIRFTAPDAGFPSRVAGTVVGTKGDSVTVQVHGEQTTLAASALQDVAVSAGHGNRLKWAFVGALAGTAAGSVNADIIRRNTWHEKHYESENVCTAGGTCSEVFHLVDTPYPKGRYIGFTAIGTVAGALLGYALPGDRWRPLSVGAASAPGGGTGVQVAVTLRR